MIKKNLFFPQILCQPGGGNAKSIHKASHLRTVSPHFGVTCARGECSDMRARPAGDGHLAHYKNFQHMFVRYRAQGWRVVAYDPRILEYSSKLAPAVERVVQELGLDASAYAPGDTIYE